jgi:hypothetical protein
MTSHAPATAAERLPAGRAPDAPSVEREESFATPGAPVAEALDQGRPAESGLSSSAVLRLQRVVGNRATQRLLHRVVARRPDRPMVQRYTEHTTKAGDFRRADDGSTLVRQDSKAGSQFLLAAPGMADAASKQLEAAKSVVRLKETGTATVKKGGVEKSFAKIEPTNVKNKTAGAGGSGMELWADCGKSARDVIGAGEGTGGGEPKAVFTDPTGKRKQTKGTASPHQMKRELMLTWLLFIEKQSGRKLIDQAKIKELSGKRDKALADYNKAAKAGKDEKTLEGLADIYFYWDEAISNAVMDGYNTKLTAKEREEIDKKAGLNRWATPDVGEGYTISTGGDPKPGFEDSTWNFHWAGVVMKSGEDTVTLENYSVGDPAVENHEWVYQMYGSAKAAEADPSKQGQTFHEQHRDVHQQHGETPTTMEVTPR